MWRSFSFLITSLLYLVNLQPMWSLKYSFLLYLLIVLPIFIVVGKLVTGRSLVEHSIIKNSKIGAPHFALLSHQIPNLLLLLQTEGQQGLTLTIDCAIFNTSILLLLLCLSSICFFVLLSHRWQSYQDTFPHTETLLVVNLIPNTTKLFCISLQSLGWCRHSCYIGAMSLEFSFTFQLILV